MSELVIEQFPCRQDNYGVLIHDPQTGVTGSIDAPEEAPIVEALESRGWSLNHILVTHHHTDHVEANAALKQRYGANIIGPAAEAKKIPGIDETVSEGDRFHFGGFEVQVIETPGHTLGHICYYIPGASVLFAADTLFALGCGRVFEGTPEQMHTSLQKLAALPDDTTVYCGHEYTMSNAAFAVTIEPGNKALERRAEEIARLRDAHRPTLPTTIGLERATNPFLRTGETAIRDLLAMGEASDAEVFAEIRRRKDSF
ncbi:hydroxyacylglutathione hydrolase [Hoeflea prorocentri]|uniref:Hydroxyacylglutathione hydrolase n=1 Tax=Hoeflea prorocentri TaxID=1922333 RepID=A0A9X3UMF7_9HYPH|nr:hydroxyacylglutathione hydrolase [Hoeflea prorocentri]MCY6383545.1 hydroxyacylglutathione hydrolase [Hoeflea prorocentri]MDA5401345.1 hydroxyacylglutathione hydrolase [Hoeflea prorocentri]